MTDEIEAKAVLQAGKDVKYLFSLFDALGSLKGWLDDASVPAKAVRALELQAEQKAGEQARREEAWAAKLATAEAQVQAAEMRSRNIVASAQEREAKAITAHEAALAFDADTRTRCATMMDDARRKLNGIQDETAAAVVARDSINAELAMLRGKFGLK